MPFQKYSQNSFSDPKLYDAYQFSKKSSKSLYPSLYTVYTAYMYLLVYYIYNMETSPFSSYMISLLDLVHKADGLQAAQTVFPLKDKSLGSRVGLLIRLHGKSFGLQGEPLSFQNYKIKFGRIFFLIREVTDVTLLIQNCLKNKSVLSTQKPTDLEIVRNWRIFWRSVSRESLGLQRWNSQSSKVEGLDPGFSRAFQLEGLDPRFLYAIHKHQVKISRFFIRYIFPTGFCPVSIIHSRLWIFIRIFV